MQSRAELGYQLWWLRLGKNAPYREHIQTVHLLLSFWSDWHLQRHTVWDLLRYGLENTAQWSGADQPPNLNQLGSCVKTSSTCSAPPPPPSGGGGGSIPKPASGASFTVAVWVCGSGDSGYSSPEGIPNKFRNQLISGYKAFSYYKRCPDVDGYQYWLGQWKTAADRLKKLGIPEDEAYFRAWRNENEGNIKKKMDAEAERKGEHLASHITKLDVNCQEEADRKYGKNVIRAVFDTVKKRAYCKVL